MSLEGVFEVRFTRQRFVHDYELVTDDDGKLIELVDLAHEDLIPYDLIREARSLGWLKVDVAFWDKWFAATNAERLDPPLWQAAAQYTQHFIDAQLMLTFVEDEPRLRVGAPLQLHISARTSKGARTRVLEEGTISKILPAGH